VSDTPISDSTPHNVADLGMLCRKLERELNASTSEIERLTNKVAQLYEGAEEAKQRIKRLEELLWLSQPVCEAKEAKP
jgi:predicted  nucleic acid-binding Zn-ribbon protein